MRRRFWALSYLGRIGGIGVEWAILAMGMCGTEKEHGYWSAGEIGDTPSTQGSEINPVLSPEGRNFQYLL